MYQIRSNPHLLLQGHTRSIAPQVLLCTHLPLVQSLLEPAHINSRFDVRCLVFRPYARIKQVSAVGILRPTPTLAAVAAPVAPSFVPDVKQHHNSSPGHH
jgi:hypothetical protein